MEMAVTDHSVLQSLQVISALLPPVLHHPAQCKIHVTKCMLGYMKTMPTEYTEALRELLQLAALLLVSSLQLLMLHPQPLLLQHDPLVQTTHMLVTVSVCHSWKQ